MIEIDASKISSFGRLLCPLAAAAVLISCTSVVKYRRSVATAVVSVSPVQTPPEPASDNINQPTSKPYTGSLSIFEDPKRDENLQVNRVMDELGIKEGT